MNDRLWLSLIRCTPKSTISRLFGRLTRQRWTRYLIPLYVKMYRINIDELAKDAMQHEHLTDFFTRKLKPQSRPINRERDSVICPVDGTVSQLGSINGNRIIQAKGHTYTVEELLGGDKAKADSFVNGLFVTLYLSPKDYHRIHAPVSGLVTEMIYEPGALFPVNERGVRLVNRLFVKNERVITYVRTHFGLMAIVKVGATNVGSVRVCYDENVQTNTVGRKTEKRQYRPAVPIQKGEELGWFEFGSTVILLLPHNAVTLFSRLQSGVCVRMGEAIGRILHNEEAL